MQVSGRDWVIALSVAVLVHAGAAIVILWQPLPAGAKSAGLGGIEIALGPAGGAPGEEAQPVNEIPETETVDSAETNAIEEVVVEKAVVEETAIEEVAIEEVVVEEPVVEETAAEPVMQTKAPPAVTPPPAKPQRTREAAKTVERPAQERKPPSPAAPGAGGKAGMEASPDAGSADDSSGGGLPGTAADYMALLQAWLEKHKEYPRQAQIHRQEGTALLFFIIDREGRVISYRVQQSSGHTILDREVEEMIERAQPLPRMPDGMGQARLELIVPVQFRLK